MKAGSYTARLRRGIKDRATPQLYVRRRTNKRASNRVLVLLEPSLRYAICVWASYRTGARSRTVSQELRRLIVEGMVARLGDDAEAMVEDAYERYAKQCADSGQPNIFEVALDA